MTAATVAADINESLNVHLTCATKVTFDDNVLIDGITKFYYFVLREVARASIRVDARLREQVLGRLQTDTEDLRQSNFNSLVTG